MTNKIKLSIVIVNFRTYPFLSRCLDSIYAGKLPKNAYEILVVDNNSQDDSARRIQKNYKKVRLLINRKNEGFAKANNRAIKKSQGEYVLTLNPDTILDKNTLSEMVRFMEKDQNIAVATCKVQLPGGELDDASHRGFPTPWNALCQFTGVSALFPHSTFLNGYHLGYDHMEKVHEIDSCAGAFMMIRREAGEQINWFDEDYFWYGEDLDFCYRVKQKGWKIMFVPDVQITHYKGISGGIKKHSQHLTTADSETKLLATKARFEVMGIFYEKHYKDKYPSWLTNIVFAGIKLKEVLTLSTLK